MKIYIVLSLFIYSLFAIELSNVTTQEMNATVADKNHDNVQVFGSNLFNGSFASNKQFRYNPNYLINIGDTINLKIWGAFELEAPLKVDSQGNVFIPKVGTLRVVGIRNDQLSKVLEESIKKEFKSNVFVYADLLSYQAVSVFVTGAVRKPGLYEGLSSDSVLQFIDKARGINNLTGSYRNIHVLRSNKEVISFDLYDFLLSGSLQPFQFQMGDVVVVDSVGKYLDVEGDVKRAYRYEMKNEFITLDELQKVVLPNPTATNVLVTSWSSDNKSSSKIYKISDSHSLKLKAGERVEFIKDHHEDSITIHIEGEHEGTHRVVVPRGSTLQDVYEKIKISNLSDAKSFQLYRKSVAHEQKELLQASLDDLEAKTLTTGSMTAEEAAIRQQEATLVSNFIKRARKVEPKGQVIINKETNLSDILLEEGDTIYIPKKSHMIIVQGEVQLPGAQTYQADLDLEDYIDSCGGYSFRADSEHVLIIHKNGLVVSYDDDAWFKDDLKIMPGDSILVLGKVDTKYLQAVKDITQIMYQIAVGASVVLRY